MRRSFVTDAWFIRAAVVGALLTAALMLPMPSDAADEQPMLTFTVRQRVPVAPDSDTYKTVHKEVRWDPTRTAVVICDMWDQHWCKGATGRVAEMAPRMNEVVSNLRDQGVLIIHAPSDTIGFYKDSPQVKLAQSAPRIETDMALRRWCHLDATREAPLPIDDSDGGCDCQPQCQQRRAWSRQIDVIEIKEGDAITDGPQAFYLMKQRGIENVIVMGVHTNMCVLGRPFSIRQMTYQGQNVVLMRDLTDTMYNSRMKPWVPHVAGTDLVVEHIEKYWCPTTTSFFFTGKPAHRFKQDTRPHIVLIAAEDEYKAAETLPKFGRMLRDTYHAKVTMLHASDSDRHDIPGMDALQTADLVVLYVRRRALKQDQMRFLRDYLAAGKPLIALRTSSHAFDTRGQHPEGRVDWADFDGEVLGGHYTGHLGNNIQCTVTLAKDAADHPILKGVPATFTSVGSLYQPRPLAAGATVLATGAIPNHEPEPVLWTRKYGNSRVVYTSLGHPGDFNNEAFTTMLVNAVYWALDKPVPAPAEKPTQVDYGADWHAMEVPGTWDAHSQGLLRGHDGFAWYRCAVSVPADWEGEELKLLLGNIDDCDQTFFNGQLVGEMGAFPPAAYASATHRKREYTVPASLVKPGELNTVAIRVYDGGGAGGFKSGGQQLASSHGAIRLEGNWQFRIGDDASWSQPSDILAEKQVGRTTFSNVGPLATPADDLKTFTLSKGLSIELVASEPQVRQPVYFTFDERGRMWVTQYLQYPFPAGLKVVGHDEFWRVKYDKWPPAPPGSPDHVEGADKITIHEDTDGDGVFDSVKTFVDGLNIATAALPGRGGVWVMNPPYLLFYPDANEDDVPDGDPIVHLEGFGLEDMHAVANSLRWGPDGWLYGCTGSTVWATVKRTGIDEEGLHFKGQSVWRYHPETRRFELFAEGGYNNFGIAVDEQWRLFTGSNGGIIGVHYVQGANYQKNWGKHGPLTNPYALGYFNGMRDESSHAKLSQAMTVYEGGTLPAEYDGKLITARVLQRRIDVCELRPDGSTYSAHELRPLVSSTDEYFRPVDIKIGPDGAIYTADWHDTNVTWNVTAGGQDAHRSTGRIYRIAAAGSKTLPRFDMRKLSSGELVARLSHANQWQRQMALRLLRERRDQSVLSDLVKMVESNEGQLALEALWGVHACGGFTPEFAHAALSHPNPQVRAWTIRLIGDDHTINDALAMQLAQLGVDETDVQVRSQLICTAKRLDTAAALSIVKAMTTREADVNDPHLPLLTWWTIENKITGDKSAVIDWLADESLWSTPMFQRAIIARLGQRFTLERSDENFEICARLFALAPDSGSIQKLIEGMDAGLRGNRVEKIPAVMENKLAELWSNRTADPALISFAIRLNSEQAMPMALRTIADEAAPEADRVTLLRMAAERREPAVAKVLPALLAQSHSRNLRDAALNAAAQYGDPAIASALLSLFDKGDAPLRDRVLSLLVARRSWAQQLLAAVEAGKVKPTQVALEFVVALSELDDGALAEQVQKHWGRVRMSDEEKQNRMKQVRALLAVGKGDAVAGKAVFAESCSKCHMLFGEGRTVGPDLTGVERDNLDHMLQSIVDPSSAVLPEYMAMRLTVVAEGEYAQEEQTIIGFIVEQTPQSITVVDSAGNRMNIATENIKERTAEPKSIMPDGLFNILTDQQIRDLMAYLQRKQSVN